MIAGNKQPILSVECEGAATLIAWWVRVSAVPRKRYYSIYLDDDDLAGYASSGGPGRRIGTTSLAGGWRGFASFLMRNVQIGGMHLAEDVIVDGAPSYAEPILAMAWVVDHPFLEELRFLLTLGDAQLKTIYDLTEDFTRERYFWTVAGIRSIVEFDRAQNRRV